MNGRQALKRVYTAAPVALLSLVLAAICAPVHGADASTDAARDGQHDFDFNVGTWNTHIRRSLDPFSASGKSIEMDGTVTVRKIWGGRAQLEEIEAQGPSGPWEGLTLFLYNPHSHQWSQLFANSKSGMLTTPLVGSFEGGRGDLYSEDTFHDRSILVHGVWSDITPDAHTYEESYSADGGKTWLPAFVGHVTRKQNTKATVPDGMTSDSSPEGAHNFDFDLGTWKTHTSRLLHPLTGSTEWVNLDGVTVVGKVWGGRANLAEFSADGPTGHLELMSLRLFNPSANQWNLNFATPNTGTISVPAVGAFKSGRGDFYDYEEINGRFVLVRFSIWSIDANTAQSEQAFSADGGKTWEVNWINKYTRINKD